MTQVGKPKFKRTKYLVSTKLQLRYVGIILLLMFVTAAICSYIVYYTVMVLMGEKLASVYPQGRLMGVINMVNIRMLLSLMFITPIVIVVGIYLSHKIAGPIYRIEKFLGDMSMGNLASRIVLRKGDELMSVAAKINVLNESLKATFTSQKANMENLISELAELERMVDSKPGDVAILDKNIELIQNQIKALEAELAKYKV